MTQAEFKLEYDKLVKVYPSQFGNEIKEAAVYTFIKDLDRRFWVSLANRIILSSNPFLDIQEAAAGERRARKSAELTSDILKAQDVMAEKITESGLSDALKQIGLTSLQDIFTKGRV